MRERGGRGGETRDDEPEERAGGPAEQRSAARAREGVSRSEARKEKGAPGRRIGGGGRSSSHGGRGNVRMFVTMLFTCTNMIVFTTRSMKFLHTITNGMIDRPRRTHPVGAASAAGAARPPPAGRRAAARAAAGKEEPPPLGASAAAAKLAAKGRGLAAKLAATAKGRDLEEKSIVAEEAAVGKEAGEGVLGDSMTAMDCVTIIRDRDRDIQRLRETT